MILMFFGSLNSHFWGKVRCFGSSMFYNIPAKFQNSMRLNHILICVSKDKNGNNYPW